jgi:hypothetical protein
VLGYQHTTSSGTLTVSLTLQNNTAAAITNLNVAYLGRVGREAEATVLRMPEWAVSFISGTNTSNVTSLTYSTTNGVAERKTAALTNLNIGTNEVFSLVWSCAAPTTGSGASRQIGISDLVVSTSEITAPPVVTGGASLAGKVGEAILPYQVVADGSPTGYAASGLPAGLSVNPVTGELSGTPTAATSEVGTLATIAASNAGGTGTATITVTIAKGDSTLQVTGTSTYAYNGTAQGPDTISKTGSAATATFSYAGSGSTVYGPSATKPTAVGSYTATASVVADANYNGVTSAEYAFSISKGTPTITAAPTASAIDQGQALSASILSGGTASVAGTFGWTDGSVVPSASGSYSVTFTPTDTANYNTASTSVNLTVNPVAGFNLNTWLAGETMSPAVLAKLAIGGASSATASDDEKPAVSVVGGQLVLSAIVRTNGPAGLTVVGEAVSSLADYGTQASIATVTGQRASVQGTVPDGCERQEFKVNQDGGRMFLRLKATLP